MAQGEQEEGAGANHHQACHHLSGPHHHDHHAGDDHAKPATSSCGGGKHEVATDHDAADAIDPVCGMKVRRETARHRFDYKGQEYLFCSGRCRERFQADPDFFSEQAQSEQAQAIRTQTGSAKAA